MVDERTDVDLDTSNRLIGEALDILLREGAFATEKAMKLSGYDGPPEDWDTAEPPPEGTEAHDWWLTAERIAKAHAKLSLAGIGDATRARRSDA